MKKRIVALILSLSLCLCPFFAKAEERDNGLLEEELALDLKNLGLFEGVSENNFALDRAPTRTEALVMLIRTLGKEKEVKEGSFNHPFNDVALWAENYVGYAYENGLTSGVSETSFGKGNASAAMYLTFILRALGYSDKEDFVWSNPYTLAVQTGILPSSVDTENFLRSDVVLISYAALGAKLKGEEQTLAQKLITEGVFSKEDYQENINLSKVGIEEEKIEDKSTSSVLNARQIYALCSDCVFYIELYDRAGNTTGSGSGFFIKENGLAVTNYHVINGAVSASAKLTDGRVCNITGVYDANESLDLALIQVEGEDFPCVNLGDSSQIVAGEDIFAIGSPLGYDNTISQGIISNVSRPMGEVNYIQFTAAISSGSSGGALINEYGQVIGVTSASSVFGDVSQNVNFAIPINLLEKLSTDTLTEFATSAKSDVIFTASVSDVTVKVGETVSLNFTHNYENAVTITYEPSVDSYVKRSWGRWKDHYNVSLRLTGLAEGKTSLSLTLYDESGNALANTSVAITVAAGDAKLSFSNTNPKVKVGESLSLNITQNLNQNITLKYNLAEDNKISVNWGNFEDRYTCPLTITGLKSGKTWLQVFLYDSRGIKLCSETLYITVTESE